MGFGLSSSSSSSLFVQIKIHDAKRAHDKNLDKIRRLGPKLAGVWARGASKKIGTPYLFLQPLKL